MFVEALEEIYHKIKENEAGELLAKFGSKITDQGTFREAAKEQLGENPLAA